MGASSTSVVAEVSVAGSAEAVLLSDSEALIASGEVITGGGKWTSLRKGAAMTPLPGG